MNKTIKSIIITALVFVLLLVTLLFLPEPANTQETLSSSNIDEDILGANFPDAQWTIINSFDGYITKFDESKIPQGANGKGQNTTVFNGDRIGIREIGYELFPSGTASTSASAIKGLHTFRKRDGTNIMIRNYSTVLEYYDTNTSGWETLKTGYTVDQTFGFADITVGSEVSSFVYFGNAVESAGRWSGNHTQLNGAVTATSSPTTIIVDSTTGFLATGTIEYCGTELAYSAKGATTFTVATAHACDDNDRLIEAVEETAANPKGNIYLAHDNRLWISGVASSTESVFFSAYGDANDFTSAALAIAATDALPGFFALGEGGGPVTGLVQDENSVYIFKKNVIRKATLSDTEYTLTTLKSFDGGKSQTTGLTSKNGLFTGGNAVFFMSPDNQIQQLSRIEGVDSPQIAPISDIIKFTADNLDFSSASGIVFRNKAYFTLKSSTDASLNDTILVWDIKNSIWDSPITGFNANEFTIYNDGTSDELYFGSSASTNVYKVNNTAIDDIYGVTASWRSKRFNFGAPHLLKDMTDLYVEGLISDNTTLTITLLLDEDGNTQSFTTDLKGTDTSYLFSSPEFNTIGLTSFGSSRFGTNDDQSGKKPFRINLTEFRALPFYNAQIEFSSDGEAEEWEILVIGMKTRINSSEELRRLQKPFR